MGGPEKTVPGVTVSRITPDSGLEGSILLAVSPFEDDLAALRRIFSRSRWKLHQCRNCPEALALLRQKHVPIVIADRAVPGGGWRRLAHEVQRLSPAPKLIVAHRFSETHSIGHILDEGAYNIIAKPFSKSEVFQAVGFAWQQWKRERVASVTSGSMSAGS
jgi:DNA-binding NtrC family response regulator